MQVLPDIPLLHDHFTVQWHSQPGIPSQYQGLVRLVLEQHHRNFQLWHEEDRARIPDASPEAIATVKRNIDRINQGRNDLMEEIDRAILDSLPQVDASRAELHSETPGMMIDRLSILSLKLYHSREEAERRDADEDHRERNTERLKILEEQRSDLVESLQRLWSGLQSGRRRFKLYRQLKMYNDPLLNPEVYRRKK